MSKKHSAKKRRKARTRKKTLCAQCRQRTDDQWNKLAALAAALNACEDAGIHIVLTGWQTIHSPKGYVLPKGRKWKAWTRDYEFPLLPVNGADPVAADGMDD